MLSHLQQLFRSFYSSLNRRRKSPTRRRRNLFENLERRALMTVDLQIVPESVYVSAATNTSITVNFAVVNNGTSTFSATVDNNTINSIVSQDNQLTTTTDNNQLGEFPFIAAGGTIGPGARLNITRTLTQSTGVTTATYPWLFLEVDPFNKVAESNENNNVHSAVNVLRPDLVLTTFKTNSINFTDKTISYNFTLKNQGSGTASLSSSDTFRVLFLNSGVFTTDVAEAPVTPPVTTLTAGQSFNANVTVPFPSSFNGTSANPYDSDSVQGRYVGPDLQQSTGNDSRTTKLFAPDLQVSNLNITSFTSSAVSFTASIRNTGSSKVNPGTYFYRAYLSADNQIDSGDVELSTGTTGFQARSFTLGGSGLLSGASQTLTVTNLPAAVNTSTRPFLLITLDADAATSRNNLVAESLEGNNGANKAFPLIDLQVTDLYANEVQTNSVRYTYTIKNAGSSPVNLNSANLTMQGFLTASNTFNSPGDVALGQELLGTGLPTLAAGQSYTGTLTQLSPSPIDPVSFPNLAVKIDGGNVIAESNEANNTRVASLARPDLIVSALKIAARTANSVSFQYTVTNNGPTLVDLNGPTGFFNDNFRLSAALSNDSVYGNAGDVVLPFQLIRDYPANLRLNPTQSYTSTFTINTGTTVTTGFAQLVVKIDSNNVLAEANENNNTKAASFALSDLLVSSVTTTIDSSGTSPKLIVSALVENRGSGSVNLNGPAAGVSDNVVARIYLSSDPYLSTSDTLLASPKLGDASLSFVLGTNRQFNSVNTLPITTAQLASLPFVIVQVDANKTVAEGDETNNFFVKRIIPLPDLSVGNLKVTSVNNTSLTYEVTIRNSGETAVDLRGADGSASTLTDNLKIQAFASANSTFDSGGVDLFLGQKDITATSVSSTPGVLQPGEAITLTYTQTFNHPTFTAQAFPNLLLKIDTGGTSGTVVESVESNNLGVAKMQQADVAVSLVDLPTNFVLFSLVDIGAYRMDYGVNFSNLGTSPAAFLGNPAQLDDDVELKVFLSYDATLDILNDVEFDTFLLPDVTLAPSQTTSLQFGSKSTKAIYDLNYQFVFVVYDWSNVSSESDKANNVFGGYVLYL